MSYRVHIIVKQRINAQELWKHIAKYPVNLVELDDSTWVYGEIDGKDLGALVVKCGEFGDIDASIQS
jgi:hypothetical protein